MTAAQENLPARGDPINAKEVKFNSCRFRSSTAIIALYHTPMAKADRQPLPCMFTANIAFKETLSIKAPEHGPDISREHSLKDGVFIVMSIESDNGWHLLASPSLSNFGADWSVCLWPSLLNFSPISPQLFGGEQNVLRDNLLQIRTRLKL